MVLLMRDVNRQSRRLLSRERFRRLPRSSRRGRGSDVPQSRSRRLGQPFLRYQRDGQAALVRFYLYNPTNFQHALGVLVPLRGQTARRTAFWYCRRSPLFFKRNFSDIGHRRLPSRSASGGHTGASGERAWRLPIAPGIFSSPSAAAPERWEVCPNPERKTLRCA